MEKLSNKSVYGARCAKCLRRTTVYGNDKKHLCTHCGAEIIISSHQVDQKKCDKCGGIIINDGKKGFFWTRVKYCDPCKTKKAIIKNH